jgi:hypothetical protein
MTKKKVIKPERILTSTLIAETLECMRIWDQIEELGNCLNWTGSTNRYGYPQYKSTTHGKCRLVRRMVWKFSGKEIERRKPLGCKCNDRQCVNPDHLFPTTTKALAQKAARAGGWTGLARAAKISANRRKSSIAKLTIEQAREIRMSEESGPVLALRYGVNRTVINGIKAGTRWKDYSNPFAGLIAANDQGRKKA